MGGSQSTPRKISVENENTIQVSKAALDRIQSQTPKAEETFYYDATPRQAQKRTDEYAHDEAYWTRRIEGLKRSHETINGKMQEEYQTALENTNDLFRKATDDSIAGKLPPCQEQRAKILQCYKDNAGKSLACSSLVNAFNNCVMDSRIAAISASL